jgi:hypothetical protein
MSEPSAPQQNRRPWWVWVNVLGLDAVAATLVWMRLFAWSCRARMAWEEYAVLGGAVWILYMADRMMDGWMRQGPREERHVFASRHWRVLVPAMLAVGGACAWLLLYRVPESVLSAGWKLGAGVAGYFVLTLVIRKNLAGLTGGLAACGCMAVALMQGNLMRIDDGTGAGDIWPHLWRGALAGVLLTIVLVTVRRPGAPAPWLLPRKLMGGWLFAMGTALAPFCHREMYYELLFSPPVLTFGAVCAVNSLGIRMAETPAEERGRFDYALMQRLEPWVLIIVAVGALTEWHATYAIARPLHGAAAVAALLLTALHFLRGRISVPAQRALADAAVILPAAVVVLFFLKK